MSSSTQPSNPPPNGSRPVEPERRRRRGGLLWLILAGVVALVVLSLLLSQCGGPDTDGTDAAAGSGTRVNTNATTATTAAESTSATPTSDPAASTSADSGSATATATGGSATASGGSATPTGGAGAGAGAPGSIVSTDGQTVLPLAAGSNPKAALTAVTGQDVTGTAVQVLSVPVDEGFWLGTSEQDRVWVQLNGDGESGYQVTEGDLVDFTGTVVAHDGGFAQSVGLTAPDGADQLTNQGQHIEVAQEALTLSG